MKLLVTLAVLTISAHAASFDCAKAQTKQEKLICSDKGLSQADEEMAAAYKQARAAGPDDATDIRLAQLQWLWQTEWESSTLCEDIRPCLATAYKARTAELVYYLDHVHRSFGTYTGTYSIPIGTLTVRQLPKGAIKFSLSLMYKYNVGNAEGELPVRNDIALFTSPEPDYPCRITMSFKKTKVKIEQDGDCGFGLNVNATGTYMKTSDK
jgi:uncharacterized protein YecT (DUF1311 family)